MNKTVNINLAGTSFYLDEDAFYKLQEYLNAIRRSLKGTEGVDEIMGDIESRIAELFIEKRTSDSEVITINYVDAIIAILGQPEDYVIDEEIFEGDTISNKNKRKRLYRDFEDKFLGGVAAGIAHYIGVEPIWIRLVFVGLFFGWGTGVLVYILLWILLPFALTTSQKLEMKGEPVNISNIQKTISKEVDNVGKSLGELGENISNGDYKKYGNKAKSGVQEIFNVLGKVITAFFGIFGKFIGVILIFISVTTLVSLLFAVFAGSISLFGNEGMVVYPPFFHTSIFPFWSLMLCMVLVVGIPFLFLLILGLKIIFSTVKGFGKPINLSLLGAWFAASFMIAYSAIEYATENSYKGMITKTESFKANKDKNISISFRSIEEEEDLIKVAKGYGVKVAKINGDNKFYSNDITLSIKKTKDSLPKLVQKFEIKSSSMEKARDLASSFEYFFEFDANDLILNDFFTTDKRLVSNSDEEINLILYIPDGWSFEFEEDSMESRCYVKAIENEDDSYYRKEILQNKWLVIQGEITCLTCKLDLDKKIKRMDSFISLKEEIEKYENNSERYTVNERRINSIGYDYLNDKRWEEAIAVFKINTTRFKESSNAFDSLGEAYYKKGDLEMAKIQFERALELNEQNSNAKFYINKIEKENRKKNI